MVSGPDPGDRRRLGKAGRFTKYGAVVFEIADQNDILLCSDESVDVALGETPYGWGRYSRCERIGGLLGWFEPDDGNIDVQ